MLPDSLTERVPAWDNVRGTGAASRRCPQYKAQQGSCKLALDGSVIMSLPQTLDEAKVFFSKHPRYCQKLWLEARWPGGNITCPHCGAPVSLPNAGRRPHCKACRYYFSERVDTLLEKSPLPVTQWMAAIWACAQVRRITSAKLGEVIGLSQVSACRLQRVIRFAQQTPAYLNNACRPTGTGWERFMTLLHNLALVPRDEIRWKIRARAFNSENDNNPTTQGSGRPVESMLEDLQRVRKQMLSSAEIARSWPKAGFSRPARV